MSNTTSLSLLAKIDTLLKTSPISKHNPTILDLDISSIKHFSFLSDSFLYTSSSTENRTIYSLNVRKGSLQKIHFENKRTVQVNKIIALNKEINILSKDGRLYSFFMNCEQYELKLNNFFLTTFVIDIANNDKIMTCVDNKNTLYYWGQVNQKYNEFPYQLDLNVKSPITKVSIGKKYISFLLLTDSVIYSFSDSLYNQNAYMPLELKELKYEGKISTILSGSDIMIFSKWETKEFLIFNDKEKIIELDIENYHISNYDINRSIKVSDNIIFIEMINRDKEKFIMEIDVVKERYLRVYQLINGEECSLLPSLFIYNEIFLSRDKGKLSKTKNAKNILWELIEEKNINDVCKIICCNNNIIKDKKVVNNKKESYIKKDIKYELEKLNKTLINKQRSSSIIKGREDLFKRNSVLMINKKAKEKEETYYQKESKSIKTLNHSNSICSCISNNKILNKSHFLFPKKEPKKLSIENFYQKIKTNSSSISTIRSYRSITPSVSCLTTKRTSVSICTNSEKDTRHSFIMPVTKPLMRSSSQPRLSFKETNYTNNSDSIIMDNNTSRSLLTSRIRNQSTILTFLAHKKKQLYNKSLID